MHQDERSTDIVDGITSFAMRQTSRRGFIKWVGKAGLAVAGAIGIGLTLALPAFATVDCQKYYPGCSNPCGCLSCCDDQDSGTECCYGECGGCGPQIYKEITSFWYYDPGTRGCQQVIDCATCTP